MLDVLYHDDTLIAVNKPAGMIVHRGWSQDDVTVCDIVRDSIVHRPIFAVHRLDRGTSGVLLLALDSQTCRSLQSSLRDATCRKRYLALVRGRMTTELKLDHAVRKRGTNERYDAITEFQPLAVGDRFSLVEARPLTGRQHQIRRHLKHLSHPVVGDVRYGKGDINRFFRNEFDFQRMALHCLTIDLVYPRPESSGAAQTLTFTAPLPEQFVIILKKLDLWRPELKQLTGSQDIS